MEQQIETEKLRKKCWMIERTKDEFEAVPLEEVEQMVGFYIPNKEGKWDVITEWEGEEYMAENQFEAKVISHQAMMSWLTLKKTK